MLKKLAIIAVAFTFAASWGMPLRARAQVLIPRSALLVQPKPAKLILATVTPSHAVVVAPDQPGAWEPIINRFDAYIDWDSVRTGGFSGTGVGESFRLQTDFLTAHVTNVFQYQRTNAAQSVLFGTLVIDENDDEDDCDDGFYWGPPPYIQGRYNSWGIGIEYNHTHPIYVSGQAYDLQGWGASVAKFANYNNSWSWYGSVGYLPSVSGSMANSTSSYNVWRYDVGAAFKPGWKLPLDLKVGFKSESWTGTGSSTGSSYHLNAPYLGLSAGF